MRLLTSNSHWVKLVCLFALILLIISTPLFADGGGGPTYTDDWTAYARVQGGEGWMRITLGEDEDGFSMAAYYDEDGYLSQFYPGGWDGSLYWEFTYDSARRVTKIERYYVTYSEDDPEADPEYELYSTTLYTYNARGQLTTIEEQNEDAPTKLTATIDAKGNSVFTNAFESDGTVYTTVETYSSKLLLLESSYSYQEAKKPRQRVYQVLHTYDAQGRRIKSDYTFDPNSDLPRQAKATMTYTWTLDEKKNPLKLTARLTNSNELVWHPDFDFGTLTFLYPWE